MITHGGQRLTEKQRIDWLRLIRTENVRPARYYGANATSVLTGPRLLCGHEIEPPCTLLALVSLH